MAKNVIINGVTYPDVPQVDIPLAAGNGDATFYDSSVATAGQGDILSGKTAFINGGEKSGTMANNGSTSADITTRDQTVSVPAGYTSGGTVKISNAEQNKIITGNIKSGVTILGISGSSTVKDVSDTTATASNVMTGSYFYTAAGTRTQGSLTVPTITQDASTKVLSIS